MKLSKASDGTIIETTPSGLPRVWMVTGCCGSGKSWVCEQLSAMGWGYVSFDKLPHHAHLDALVRATALSQGRVVFDPGFKVTTLIRAHLSFISYKLVVIQESIDVIRSRILARGGRFNEDSIVKRMKRHSAHAKLAVFTDTSTEVLKFLVNCPESECAPRVLGQPGCHAHPHNEHTPLAPRGSTSRRNATHT